MEEELNFEILPLVLPNAEENVINKEKIRSICSRTLEENPPEDRCLAWLVLLGVYPMNPSQWDHVLEDIKDSYWLFVKEFKVDKWNEQLAIDNLACESIDLPDSQLMFRIYNDIIRTSRQILFFPPQREYKIKHMLGSHIGYIRRLERILFVFAQCNRTLCYIQGFNEIITPLYYVVIRACALFRNDNNLMEAVTFSMFQNLITSTRLQELYTTQDQSSIIFHCLDMFSSKLKVHMPQFAKSLEDLTIHPAIYSYRWFNLLFAQEYDLPTLLLLWDTLFSNIEDILDFCFYIGIAHLKQLEKSINIKDYSSTIITLQDLKSTNIVGVINDTYKIWETEKRAKKR